MRKWFLIFALTAIFVLVGINVYLTELKLPNHLVVQSTNSQLDSAIIPPVEAAQVTSIDSLDGKLTLSMKTVKKQNELSYSFTIAGKEIFTKTTDLSTIISIPYNTWSPDEKYIFLKETSPAGANFFALSTSISSADQNDRTASITDLFAKKYPDLSIGDVTGWGGMNLIIVNSVKNDGKRGPSFWFEMPSKGFIQLSVRF